jgi:hypothetical protein
MQVRRLILAALFACAACKGKGDAGKAGSLDQRCEQLATACGDTQAHITSLGDACKHAASTQQACADKVSALYDCYEKQVCGKGDRIWAFEDFGVLAVRKNACVAERKAVSECK